MTCLFGRHVIFMKTVLKSKSQMDLNPQILHLQAATYNDDPFNYFLLKQLHVYLVAGELV